MKKMICCLLFLLATLKVFAVDISIDKSISQREYDNGDTLTYTVSIKNESGTSLSGVTLTEDLFLQVEDGTPVFTNPKLVSALANSGGSVGDYTLPNIGSDFVARDINFTSPLEEITYVFEVDIVSGVRDEIEASTTVEVGGAVDNTETVAIVRTTYDYEVAKNTLDTSYTPGENTSFTVRLSNNQANTIKGIVVKDILSDIQGEVLDGTGDIFVPGSIEVVSVTSGEGTDSGLSSNPFSGDLDVNTASLGPNGWILYTLRGQVNLDVIGNIENTAEVSFTETTRDTEDKVSNTVIVTPGLPDVVITKSASPTSDYFPGSDITYNITITNNGLGIAKDYKIEDLLSTISSNLSSDLEKLEDASDISGAPFVSGTTELKSIGANSRSTYSTGNFVPGLDLSDTVSIFPGESLTYQIVGTTGDNAIGEIENTVKITSLDGSKEVFDKASTLPGPLTTDVEIIKTTNVIEYTPGGEVVYTIRVTNKNPVSFANDIPVVDKIGSIIAEQLGGADGQAFSEWTLNVKNLSSLKSGTNPDTAENGTPVSTDINLAVDLAPGDEIIYELVAKISETTIGEIFDGDTTDPDDTVVESGNGIIMSTSKLNIGKLVEDTVYSPNEVIIYKLIVENDGNGYALNIPVIDLVSQIMTEGGDRAYSTWEIDYSLEEATNGTLTPTGNPGQGVTNWPLIDTDLDVIADLGPESRLVYEIKTTIDSTATGRIVNTAIVDGSLVADKGIRPTEPNVSAEKRVDMDEYSASDYQPGTDFIVTYYLTISNEANAGYAENIDVQDNFRDIVVELLDGGQENVFIADKIEITAIDGLTTSGNTSNLSPGIISGGILSDTINVTAGSSITYEIKATVNKDLPGDIIPYSTILNQGVITPKKMDGSDDTTINVSADTVPKMPRLLIEKTPDVPNFASGGTVEFTITVENVGNGFANNAVIEDSLPTGLVNWEITAIDGTEYGTNPFVSGTLPGENSGPSTEDLNVVVDIAPGDKVQYKVVATVSDPYTEDTITNTAKVSDVQNNIESEASAKINKNTTNVHITKRADKTRHIPGDKVTYTIEINNTNGQELLGYRILDEISAIEVNLANDGNPYTDVVGSPFSAWTIDRTMGGVTTTLTPDVDLDDTIDILSTTTKVTYEIVTEIKDSVLANQKITNEVRVFDNSSIEVGLASTETNGGGNYGGITRSVDENYIPGEELEYTITLNDRYDVNIIHGYYNNKEIEEKISEIQVEVLDGSFEPVFFNPETGNIEFEVTRIYPSGASSGSSPISSFPDADNTDLDFGPVDLAPEDQVVYKITGVVRPDAIGNIDYKELTTEPYPYNLNVLKRSLGDFYIPGEEETFFIEIFNNSDGNAGNIDIEDLISDIKVLTSAGVEEAAFLEGWKTEIKVETLDSSVDYKGFANGDIENRINDGVIGEVDIDTRFDLPIKTKLIYEVTGIVNPKAIADIENTVTVDGDRTTGEAASGKSQLNAEKTIEKYFDRDGTTELQGGYKPGGWIQYLVSVDNENGVGIRNNLEVTDLISEIETSLAASDGTPISGAAFSEWEITFADDQSILDANGVTTLGPWQGNQNRIIDTEDLVGSGSGGVATVFDLAPGGKVAFRIKARVDERAVGAIENIVSSGAVERRSGNSNTLTPIISISKDAFEDENLTIPKIRFEMGDEFYYKVKVENSGNGISVGRMSDLFNDIRSSVAEDGTNTNNPKGLPFDTWEIEALKSNTEIEIGDINGPYNNGEDNVTNLDDFEPAGTKKTDEDINSDTVYIAPGGEIEYVVKITVANNVVGEIINSASYQDQTGTKTDNITITPYDRNISIEKDLKYVGESVPATGIGGNYPSSVLTTYTPGDYVIYEFSVSNLSSQGDPAGFANNVLIEDELSSMIGDIAGGNSDVVFESWDVLSDGGSDSRTYVRGYVDDSTDLSDGSGLDVRADISPEDTIIFKVTGKIREDLVGSIPENTASAANASDTAPGINPIRPDITYYKTFGSLQSPGVEDDNDQTYVTLGDINYKIVIENTGEGYGNDISVVDIIRDVVDGNGNQAFSSSSTSIVITDSDGGVTNGTNDSRSYVSGTSSGSGALDVNVDIEPGAKIEFYITAVVAGSAEGDINNEVDVSGVPEISIESGKKDNVTATLSTAVIEGIKTVSSEFYTPGGQIEFTLEVRNRSDSRAANVILTDLISDIKVNIAGEASTTPPSTQALKPGWTIDAVLIDEDTAAPGDVSAINALGDGEDIVDVTIDIGPKAVGEAYSRAVITITGNVIDNATGNITNSFDYTYDNSTNIRTATVFPTLTVSPNSGISISKKAVEGVAADKSSTERFTYIPGEELTFLVELENIFTGYASGVEISDVITGILTELAGEFTVGGIAPGLGLAFDSSEGVDVVYEETALTLVVDTPDESQGFVGDVDIHPGEIFKIWITGTVGKTTLGDIENTSTARYNGSDLSASAMVVSSADTATDVLKEIKVNNGSYTTGQVEYMNGDVISYRLTQTNNGDGWGNDYTINDNVSQIMANISGGGTGNAFISETIGISYSVSNTDYDGDYSRYIEIDNLTKDLNAVYDLAPKGTITFEVTGTVKDNVLGNIENTGKYGIDGNLPSIDTNTVIASQDGAQLSITKEIIVGEEYVPGQEIGYKIEVANLTDSFADDVKIVDDLSIITVESSLGETPDPNAFISYRVVVAEINDPSKIVSSDTSMGLNAIVDLAPNDKVVFEVYGTLINSPIGDVENIATYEYLPVDNGNPQETQPVVSTPINPVITITKESDIEDYVLGGEINYTIEITNTGGGIADNISFEDDLAAIISELSDGSQGRAIAPDSVEASINIGLEGSPSGITTSSPDIDVTNDNVTSLFDLAPNGAVRISIKAEIEENVVGDITNTATADYGNKDPNTSIPTAIDTIGPGNADISIIKNSIVDPAIGGYIPGEDIEFEILISNAGPGMANNISLVDELSKIMVETVDGDKAAFSSFVITNEVPVLPSFIPPYDSGADLDIKVDINPEDTLKFNIIATVIDDAYGEIKNTATARFENDKNNDGSDEPTRDDDATFIPSRSNVVVEKTVSLENYAPGDEIIYTITVGNTGPGPANEVKFEDILPQATTTTGQGDALDLTSLVITKEIKGGLLELEPIYIDEAGEPTLRSTLTIPRDGEIIYKVTGNISNNVIGNIENTATAPYTDNDGTDKTSGDLLPTSETVVTLPKLAELKILKTVDKDEFIAGEEITYTVTVENVGEGIANDVKLLDLILSIDVQSVYEEDIKAFKSVVITDNAGELKEISAIGDYSKEDDLDVMLDIVPGDTVKFVLVGTTDLLVAEDITNEASFNFTNNDGSLGSGKSEVTSEVKLNEGELILTKTAFKDEVEKGEVVEYEILVRNQGEVYFLNVAIEDKIPAGFGYVEDTTEMTLSGPDGVFDTDDDVDVSDEPVQGNTLGFTAVDIGPKEILRIRYLLRASIGTTFGKYTNTAYAISGGKEVSNRDSATVEVIPDELFDTGTIIGKVFEDLNGNGYQGDATAKRIKIQGGVSEASYVPNSTTLEVGGRVKKVPDASPPLQHGVNIGTIRGVSRNRKVKEANKAVIRYETIDTKWEPLKITTKAGTDLLIDKDGKVTESHKKDKKKGLARENLKITRNIYKQKGKTEYLQEIIIENLGIYEDGIPGVRLITVDGILVETDEFGRYHVPDEWILRKNGKNFIIKVDEDTLPQGMRVISENPRVRRISPNGLNKFNFSVQREDDDFEIRDPENLVKLSGDENE